MNTAPTLEEQIANRCIYFNGMANAECQAGVNYEKVRVDMEGPYMKRIPCFKKNGIRCINSKFLTVEEVAEKMRQISDDGTKGIMLLVAVKNQYAKNQKEAGQMQCPNCGGTVTYSRAQNNGHFRISCIGCKINLVE